MPAPTASPAKLAYSIPEACRSLSISRSKLYELIRTKRIPVVKVGTRTLVRVADLVAFLDKAA